MKKGLFVSLEGIDGAGKTSLKEILIPRLQKQYDIISIREPGGTVISEKIRHLLLDAGNSTMGSRTEALLYAAARSQVVEEVIQPALEAGKLVLADRFLDSTIAYQGYGRGMDLSFLHQLNHLCTGGIKPDLTLLLDIEPELAYWRRRGETPDRLEQEGLNFQARVRAGYLELWKEEPQRIKCLDGSASLQDIAAESLKHIEQMVEV
ncbi:MAG TPA: dTMP kinase [Syntrophomonadaceae bacterium]|nr:dTMP kinase [Syntrophomonadaceae bacterium]